MTSEPWSDELTAQIESLLPGTPIEFLRYLGQEFMSVTPDAVIPMLETLKRACGFDYLVDITAVDYPKRAERFDLVYILYSYAANRRIRVKTAIAGGSRPFSATSVFLGANWLEREVYDMFGIEFDQHPNLKRILLPEEWTGFPLRKDYSIIQQDQAWVQENLGIESGQ